MPPGIPRFYLPLTAVRIDCLDKKNNVLSVASGFILEEADGLYLYTCWHVVTGYDPDDLKFVAPPGRVTLVLHFQEVERQANGEIIRGHQSVRLDLYDDSTVPRTPLWLQNFRHRAQPDLNLVNIRVPYWNDLIKLRLPEKLNIPKAQVISADAISHQFPTVGEKVYLVGYPYGYSAMGMKQPTPLVLTRFVAAEHIEGRIASGLLDGIGAAGMSGCPVFVEKDGLCFLYSVYTGSIYPDYFRDQNNPVTALGKITNLALVVQPDHLMELVRHDDTRVTADLPE